jgi:hypothetical protein
MVKRNEPRVAAVQRMRVLAKKLNVPHVADNSSKDKVLEMAAGAQAAATFSAEDAIELEEALAAYHATWADEAS